MSKPRASSAFTYWTDGSNQVAAEPDPPSPEEAKPFVVRGETGNAWRPINVIVFARDEEHAVARVRAALEQARELDYKGAQGRQGGTSPIGPNQAFKLLDLVESGEMTLTVAPYDVAVMTKVAWASNDVVC